MTTRHTTCRKCNSPDTACVDSRIYPESGDRHRRYKCYACGFRWSTMELDASVVTNLYKVRNLVDVMTRVLVGIRSGLHGLDLSKLASDSLTAQQKKDRTHAFKQSNHR